MRIRRHGDFQRVLRAGVRVVDGRLTVWALPNGLDTPRIGLIVGKKHGNAVARNRLRRLVREAFRLCQRQLPTGVDLACAPRQGAEFSLQLLQASLTSLGAKAVRRLEQRKQ